jgi:hypothetical protein
LLIVGIGTAKETALLSAMRLSFAFSVVAAVVTVALRLGLVCVRFEMTVTAALGVFDWFQIANFYVFLGCCHNISFAVSG